MTAAGAPPEQPNPISPEKLKLMELPSWEEISNLLENPVMREFRLDIETDSTIRMDEEMETEARLELFKAVAEFLQQAVQDLGLLLDLARRPGPTVLPAARVDADPRRRQRTYSVPRIYFVKEMNSWGNFSGSDSTRSMMLYCLPKISATY